MGIRGWQGNIFSAEGLTPYEQLVKANHNRKIVYGSKKTLEKSKKYRRAK